MSSRLLRSAAPRVMRRDSLVTNGCSASDTSCPICAATLMATLSAGLYLFLLIQINKRDEAWHRRKWHCDGTTLAVGYGDHPRRAPARASSENEAAASTLEQSRQKAIRGSTRIAPEGGTKDGASRPEARRRGASYDAMG